MPRPYPPEFRARAIALVRAGKQAKQTAFELGIHPVTLSTWLRQDDIDNGRHPGLASSESAELRSARRRIRELETELGIIRQATKFLGEDRPDPKRLYPVIERLVDAGAAVDRCCRVLGVTRQSYYKQKRTLTTPTQLRRQWLTGLGLTVVGRDTVSGEWTDTAVGLDGNHANIAMLQTPDGHGRLELFGYIHPQAIESEPTRPNEIGMHRVAFSVDDIDEALEIVARHGCLPLRGVATYEDVYKITYVCGPSGIIVMLAEDLKKS